jgi:hypothetical protein
METQTQKYFVKLSTLNGEQGPYAVVTRLVAMPLVDELDIIATNLTQGWTVMDAERIEDFIKFYGLSYAHGESGLSGFSTFKAF